MHGENKMNKNLLTKEQLDFYRDTGYIIIKGAITIEEADVYRERIRLHANPDYAAIMNPDRLEFLVAQSDWMFGGESSLPDKVKYVEFCKETARLTEFFLKHPNIVPALEALQGEEIVGLMTQMLFKEAASKYAPQAWNPHQDNAYPQSKNGKYITTNVWLEDADIENGTLYAYPESHKNGIYEFERKISYREVDNRPGNKISDEILSTFKKVDLTFKKGDVIVMNGNMIHGSYPNVSKDRNRPFLSCCYISKGEAFNPGYNSQKRPIDLKLGA